MGTATVLQQKLRPKGAPANDRDRPRIHRQFNRLGIRELLHISGTLPLTQVNWRRHVPEKEPVKGRSEPG